MKNLFILSRGETQLLGLAATKELTEHPLSQQWISKEFFWCPEGVITLSACNGNYD